MPVADGAPTDEGLRNKQAGHLASAGHRSSCLCRTLLAVIGEIAAATKQDTRESTLVMPRESEHGSGAKMVLP